MHRLVVPVDFSEFAQDAIGYAAALAKETAADVHLLHIASPSGNGAEVHREANQDALQAAATHAGLADATCAIRVSYAISPAVLAYAEEVSADAIVTGTHGRRGFRRLMLGSVTEELVRTASMDVWVVPKGAFRIGARPGRRVLVPVDLRHGSDILIAHARSVATALHSERLDLLHVVEPLPYPVRWLDEAVLDIVPTIRGQAAEELRQLATDLGITTDGVYVERGDPAPTIVRSADALDADLVVVAPHEQQRIEQALLGSVAATVARTSKRPVLVARSLDASLRQSADAAASVSHETPSS